MNSKFLILIISVFTVLYSCKKDDKTYQNDSMVEFSKNEDLVIIPFSEKNTITLPIKVQLNSKAYGIDKNIQIVESDTNSVSHRKYYTLNNKTILLADSIFAIFYVQIQSKNFNENESITINFIFSDSSQISPAKNYNKFTLIIKKQSFQEVFIGKYLCSEPVNQDLYTTQFIPGTLANTIKNTNFWNFPADGQTVEYTISKDSTMAVEIVEQDWVDKSGQDYKISGKGTYDFNGNLIVNYSVFKNGLLYEEGTHTFNPLK